LNDFSLNYLFSNYHRVFKKFSDSTLEIRSKNVTLHISGGNPAGVVDTGGKFATGVVDTGGAPLLANISANFRKNSKRSQWDTLGLGGN
jgi:hypothetical protein